MDLPAAIPLVIGVTGHRDLVEDEAPAIRERVREYLSGLRARWPNTPLIVASQRIDRLAIPDSAKRELKRMLSAAANPDNDKIDTIIKTLPKERQEEIIRIFDEVFAMQQANEQAARNNLLLAGILTLGSLIVSYLLTTDQQALQAAQLFEINKRTWINAIQGEIDYCGCNRSARGASGSNLEVLRQMALDDAASIVATYHKAVQRQLETLYKDNPTASKAFFIESMKAWAEKRAVWKGIQVAANTEFKARSYAQARFRAENFTKDALYLFVGPPTTCADCTARFAAGKVDLNYTLRYPVPRHPNCPHQYRLVRKLSLIHI